MGNEDWSHRKNHFARRQWDTAWKRKKNKTPAHEMMADIAMSGERKYQHLVQEPASWYLFLAVILWKDKMKKDKTLTSCLISWREGVKSAKLLSELPSQSNDISFLAKSSGKAWKLYFRNITDVIPNQRLSSSTYWPFYPKIFLCQFYVAHKNLQHFLTFTSLLLLNNVKITAL